MTGAPVLALQDLTCVLDTPQGDVAVVRDVSLQLHAGETVGLVGESGSGKSMLSLAILGLLPAPIARIAAGHIFFEGSDLATAKERHLRRVRGNRITMVFQDPMTSLNPFLTIGRQLTEVWQAHHPHDVAAAHSRALAALHEVGLADAAGRMHAYPHQFSGGMRQRVMIAMALLCTPSVLLADEPTTALDVTVQAQVLALLAQLQATHNTAILLISHDLAVVASHARRIAVMYAGRIVELAAAHSVYHRPRHPYTQALWGCIPSAQVVAQGRLTPIPGQPAQPGNRPSGCAFRPRCGRAVAACAVIDPPLQADAKGDAVACHNPVVTSAAAVL